MAIKIGDVVGNYKVIDLAGSGGMGAVYKIEHVISKRVEAMKLLPVGIDSDPEQVQRFEREIQVQARLHHPNIAALYNAVRDGQSVALIMEYVEGVSLERMLEAGRLPVRTAVNYAGQVLEALAYAHQEGVIHRDVAPANIIITRDGTAKLTDFGLARTAADPRLSTTGVAMGSPWYMSPEQVRALEDVDARTDIYAMGAVLHEMITGRKLFDVDGAFAVMCAHTETVPQPPSAYNPEVPPALDHVVAKALAKDPAARYQTAGEFRRSMNAAVGLTSAARPAGLSLAARLAGMRPSRSAILVLLAPASVVAVVSTMLLLPRTVRVAAKAQVPAAVAVVTQPAPLAVTEPPAPAGAIVPAPDVTVPVDAAKPSNVTAPRSARRADKPDQNFSIRVSGGVVEPRPVMPSGAPHSASASVADPSAPKADIVEAPAPPPVPAANPADEPESAPPPAAEAKPQKSGNKFVRALGRLNPFRKSANHEPDDPSKAPAKKN